MKCLKFFILCLIASPAIAGDTVDHSHDGRKHRHILPSIGIAHTHIGLGAGVAVYMEAATSVTTGEKSPIINQPESVVFNDSHKETTEINGDMNIKSVNHYTYTEGDQEYNLGIFTGNLTYGDQIFDFSDNSKNIYAPNINIGGW